LPYAKVEIVDFNDGPRMVSHAFKLTHSLYPCLYPKFNQLSTLPSEYNA